MARYREIAEDLTQRIARGDFPPGAQLPSIADLQREYQVLGLNTVRQAQQLLVEAGLIETKQGVGTFVLRKTPRPRLIDPIAALKAARGAQDRAITALERAS